MSQYVNLWMRNQKADENKQSSWILLNSYSRSTYTYDAISNYCSYASLELVDEKMFSNILSALAEGICRAKAEIKNYNKQLDNIKECNNDLESKYEMIHSILESINDAEEIIEELTESQQLFTMLEDSFKYGSEDYGNFYLYVGVEAHPNCYDEEDNNEKDEANVELAV